MAHLRFLLLFLVSAFTAWMTLGLDIYLHLWLGSLTLSAGGSTWHTSHRLLRFLHLHRRILSRNLHLISLFLLFEWLDFKEILLGSQSGRLATQPLRIDAILEFESAAFSVRRTVAYNGPLRNGWLVKTGRPRLHVYLEVVCCVHYVLVQIVSLHQIPNALRFDTLLGLQWVLGWMLRLSTWLWFLTQTV